MKNLIYRNSVITGAIFLLILMLAYAFNPRFSIAEPPFELPPGLEKARQAQELNTPSLMEDTDVVGTAIGEDVNGNAIIHVFLKREGVGGIPSRINGISVVKQVTGEIVAYKGRPGGSSGTSGKTKQITPIKLGTSGGWRYDLANGYCCGGTLGSLIKIGSTQYVLSNYHVLYSDIVNGGNGRTTGLSKSTVSGLNATVSIAYDNECAGGDSFTKTFTGQIITKNNSCGFLNGGDSGSLMVQDLTTNPKAVGLLYAGSVTCNKFSIAVASPINEVLSYFGATMVGN